jgi:hypothetical protein
MFRMRGFVAIGVLVVSMCSFDAWAQGTITGQVTDDGGAAVGQAVIEVESPSTIEQRLTISDAAGRYRFEDLRPGTYAVTAVRPGFKVLRIEGVEVSGSRTVLVEAPLMPGSPQEVVTLLHVGAPVDARSAIRQMTIDDSVIRMIPNRRN